MVLNLLLQKYKTSNVLSQIFTSSKEESLHVGNSVFGFGIFEVQIFFFFER